MRRKFVLAMTCVVAFAALARAEDAPKKEEVAAARTAVFAVPDLGDDSVKRLTAALAKTEGIVSAKAESDKGRFLVTFETAKTDAEALTALVTNVAPDAKLEAVEDAKAAGPDCGKCPSRSSCGKAKSTS